MHAPGHPLSFRCGICQHVHTEKQAHIGQCVMHCMQALASRRSSEWASTSVGTQQQQRGRGSRELSRRSSWDLAGQVWIARHPLQLCSATHDILGKELPYTSCHGKFIGSVDFVWFSPTVCLLHYLSCLLEAWRVTGSARSSHPC